MCFHKILSVKSELLLKINIKKHTIYSIFTKSYKVAKQYICLNLNKHQLMKEDHPTYLGVKFDLQLSERREMMMFT